MIVAGFDIGGAHLKVTRVEEGCVVASATVATPLWQGLEHLDAGFEQTAPLHAEANRLAFTMTGELSDAFASRDEGVATLIDRIGRRFAGWAETLIYAGPSGLIDPGRAAALSREIASANWHATATLVAKLVGDALFVDMGSTTTDIIPVHEGAVASRGYTDAERLATGELVYTGFTRSLLFAIAARAPVRGAFTPLMNEYFASMADVHRLLGELDEADDKHPSADGKEKTSAGSTARLARMVGRDAADLDTRDWRNLAQWFAEQQLRLVHDAAFLVAGSVGHNTPVVGAGIGRPQIRRLSERMGRRYMDFAATIPAADAVRDAACAAAPATAVALLAGLRR